MHIINDIRLTLEWSSNPNVKVKISIQGLNGLGLYGHGFFAEVEREPPLFFLDIPSCQNYNVSFKAVFPNGTSSIQWFQTFEAEIKPEDLFELTNMTITVNNVKSDGNAFVKWQHDFGCVNRYAILVIEEGVENPKKGKGHISKS